MTGTIADWVLFYLRKMERGEDNLPFDLYFRCMDLGDRLLLDYNVLLLMSGDC